MSTRRGKCDQCDSTIVYESDNRNLIDCLFIPTFGWICGTCLDKMESRYMSIRAQTPDKRIPIDEYFLKIASIVSLRSTCPRRRAGAVLIDRNNKLLSTGYNGNPSGHSHCIDIPCPGAFEKSGEGLDKCEAIHAEINAIAQCLDSREIHTCYATTSPCIHCIKSLLATNCKNIVFMEEYPHSEAKTLWEKSGRTWRQLKNYEWLGLQ